MSKELCRLCFVEKARPIDIFSAKGIELNIAETIRVHFADEVSKDDHLPNTICRLCWITLKNFHEFYNAVNEAKSHFLMTFVKIEEPKFMEINWDTFGEDSDIPVVKHDSTTDCIAAVEDIIEESDAIDHGRNEGIDDDDDGDESDSKEEHKGEWGRKRVQEIAKDETITDVSSRKNEPKASDHSISNYLNMFCELCQQPFDKLTQVGPHYKNKHQCRSVTLKCCERQMKIADIRSHIQYHLNPDKFKCVQCDKTYIAKSYLDNHLSGHRKKRFEFQCDICKKKMSSKMNLRSHILRIHANEQGGHKCELCDKRFILSQQLSTHVKQVHERRYDQVCHICAKVYNSKQSMIDHLKKHSNIKEPEVSCSYCGKSYSTKRLMETHVRRTHKEDGKVYECPECHKLFERKTLLDFHIVYHHSPEPHKCSICDREFKIAKYLKEHMATHTGIDLYTCAYCPKTFKCSSNKYKHHKQAHLNQWNADRKTQNITK